MFDFLREVVSKVPDYGSSDAAGAAADTSKRRCESFWFIAVYFSQQIFMKFVYFIARKVAANELNESDEESKRNSMV